MNASPCIPKTDLAQFIRGSLASERRSEIAEHVDHCDACQVTVVARTDNEDTFVVALREDQAERPVEREAALRQGMRRMDQRTWKWLTIKGGESQTELGRSNRRK